jgi:hypothetical protein
MLSPPISISEPEFIFARPADHQVDYVSATKTYSRIWAITQSTANAVGNLRVVATCNKTNIAITQIELVDDILGTNVIPVDMTGALDAAPTGAYHINIGASVLSQIGNNDTWFDNGETIFIRETYKVLTCNTATTTYTYGYGDGTNFCFATVPPIVTTASVVLPSYTPDITNTRNMTFPLSAADVGTMSFTLTNNSADPKAFFYDTRVAVWVNDLSRYVFTRAYLVDAAGVPLGFPDLVMTNNTPYYPGGDGANARRYIVTFENLNDPMQAAAYQAAGLVDADGDGNWNDLPAGNSCYIKVEYQFVPPTTTDPNGCIGNLYPTTTSYAYLYYKNSCGDYQRYIRAYVIGVNTTTTNHHIGFMTYEAPQVITITPENFTVLQDVVLRINESPLGSVATTPFINRNNYDQYIIVTLPKGFDYDDTQQGFRINTYAPCALADVIRTVVDNRVVLTVHNRVGSASNSNYYRITMFATVTIDPDDPKTINLQHGWNWKNDPGFIKYGCHFDLPVNYFLIDPYQNMTLTAFNAQRMTFGYDDHVSMTRITLANIGSYPNVKRDVAGPFDNVDMTGTIEIESGLDRKSVV